jgi:hypothetical protein
MPLRGGHYQTTRASPKLYRPSSPRAPLLWSRYPPSSLYEPMRRPQRLRRHFGLCLIGGVLAACAIHGWSLGPSRLSACFSFLKCRAPYAGGSSGALDQFYPDDFGLRQVMQSSTPALFLPTASGRHQFRHGRHSFMLRPSSLLALLAVQYRFQHSRAFPFELSASSLGLFKK